LAILLCLSNVFALNIDLQISPIKPEFTNEENIVLDVNIVNYEIFSDAESVNLVVKVNDQNIIREIGIVKPDGLKQTTIELGQFPAGNYSAEAFLEYDFLGVVDQTQIEYFNLRVIPSEPIEMETYTALIKEVLIPSNTEVNKEFEIKVEVLNNLGQLTVEFLFEGKKYEREINEKGTVEVAVNLETQRDGIVPLEIKLIATGSTQQSKIVNLVISNPENYRKVASVELTIQKGEVIIESGKEPENVIEEIGCFVVGGCKGDLSGPDVENILMQESTNSTYFEVVVNDSQVGNSTIKECQINIKGGWRQMLPRDGSFDSPNEIATYTLTEIIYETQQIIFRCTDSFQNTTTITTEAAGKEKGTIKIIVSDKILNQRIKGALIYLNDELKGATNQDGEFSVSTYAMEYNLKISAKGYVDSDKKVLLEEGEEEIINIELAQSLEQRFEVPPGFEKYVYAEQASHTVIHPQEKRLLSYSFPILSLEKVDVAKDLIEKVDDFLFYDGNCWPERNDDCQAWHDSEYDVIEAGRGVCYDWATLGTSFSDSYGIPSRYTRGCWYRKNLHGTRVASCHAWQEVYLSEEGGWIHMDTLWNRYNDPCVYSRGMSLNCVGDFIAFDPQTKQWIPRDDVYVCGKPCDSIYLSDVGDETEIFDNGYGFDYSYNVKLNAKSAEITFGRNLTAEETEDLKGKLDSGDLNEAVLTETLFSTINSQFENLGKTKNIELIELDSNNLKDIKIQFELEFDNEVTEFNHSFTISQYSTVNYSLETAKPIFSISPALAEKVEGAYYWVFNEAGEHTINIVLREENVAFVLTDNPLSHLIVENAVRKLDNAELFVLYAEDSTLNQLINGSFSKVYLFGTYSEISSSFEKRISEKNIAITRVTGDATSASQNISSLFWINSDEAVIGSAYDFDSAKQAKNKSVSKGLPLLLIEDSFDSKTRLILENMGVGKIYLADPNNKISQETRNQITSIAKLEEILPEREQNSLKLISEEKSSHSNNSNITVPIVVIGVIGLGIAIYYFKIMKK